jgi:outer membrane protein insertion porin family|tara:strand:+ start:752 stop:2989 length:2238 start_codon:yes stop_codon:yes gene_type:complete
MIVRILYLLAIFFLVPPILNAEVINQIIIDGNKRVSDETIKVYGEIKINQNISETEINNVLNNLYSTNFFEDVKIQINNNIINIKVIEYPVVNQLIIIGENRKSYRDQIKKLIKLKEKKAFVKPYLAKDIETIKKLYSSLGYNFSNIETKIRTIDEDNLDLMIEVDRGNQTKISSISFIGNKSIRSNRLKNIIASEENKFWKFISKNTNFSNNLIGLDKRLLENFYKSIGFYDVQVTSNIAQINNVGNADISYTINEGTRYRINKISTNVDKVFDKEIFFPLNKIFKEYAGEYYSPFKVKELLEELDQIIEFNNLQFVEHNVKEVVQNDSINITFNIFEGKKTLVERINITGNVVTNEEVIRGELILDEGDPFINLNLEKSISEIKQRGIFKTVTHEVIEGSKKNLKIININVEEQPTGEISAGAGIGTTGGTFAFTVTENNWLGAGKNVSFDVQVDKEKLAGKILYLDPNYDFLGNSLSYSLSSTSNDKPDMGFENNIISAGVGTRFQQYKDVNVNLGLSASYDDLKTEGTASASLKKQSGTFTELAANYGFSFDKRDRVFMPSSGSIIGFSQELPIYADKAYLSNTLTSSTYKSLNEENIIGAAKFYLTTVNGLGDEDVRISKRKGLSNRRLRGFEKNKIGPVDGTDHVGGNYAAALNFESNLPNLLPENTNTDISLFLDFGNVWGVDYDSTIDNSNKIRSTTGVAASWSSPLGPMTFILSQNLSKASTDKTEAFTFNLGTTF